MKAKSAFGMPEIKNFRAILIKFMQIRKRNDYSCDPIPSTKFHLEFSFGGLLSGFLDARKQSFRRTGKFTFLV